MSDAPLTTAAAPAPTRGTYLGLFLVTLATLAFQILLTRIFSVTVWYHLAFLTVSIAMLGVTIGAIAVYVFPERFDPARTHLHMARSAWVFALSIVIVLTLHLAFPIAMDGSVRSYVSIALLCLLVAIPFSSSGVCVALALTRFPASVSRLYAADLGGAALGCLSVLGLLAVLDGPSAIVASAALANLGALCFSADAGAAGRPRWVAASAAGLVALTIGNAVLATQQNAPLRVGWMVHLTGQTTHLDKALHESWNSHALVRVVPDSHPNQPFGWSLSAALPKDTPTPKELGVEIDTGAYTVMTRFDGNANAPTLEHLRYDLTNIAHYLRDDADVLVIGAGAGRDLLSALVFDQRSVTGVEINADVLDSVHRVFGNFSGHLDQHPKVTIHNDEARSWVARSRDRYDLIQISLIDSFAATAAGAFVLTEHSLYTVEAWESFLEHLTDDGILTLTRYFYAPKPATAYRLVSLAVDALAARGVENPRDHIAMVRLPERPGFAATMVTILVSPTPFSASDVAKLRRATRRLQFKRVLEPGFAVDPIFEGLARGGDREAIYADFALDIRSSTDNRPFFFHMLRFRDLLDPNLRGDQGFANFNIRAVLILGFLLATVTTLTLVFVIVPLALRNRLANVPRIAPWFLVFAGIGTGFMMVEISQIERLIVFLGHPVYSLSVVLFSLLLASGLGSFSTDRIPDERLRREVTWRVAALLAALALFGGLTPAVIDAMEAASTPARIATSVALLLPIGFLMGMPFPLGMRLAAREPTHADLTPWLWGMNGSFSVVASVLAIVVAMSWGIATSFALGFASYAVAGGALLWLVHRN